MKKIIPFTKDILFTTSISKITDISVTHELDIEEDNEINGFFNVSGTYRILDTSMLDETFEYQLPFTAIVDQKYDLTKSSIRINDFTFDIKDEDTLNIKVELELSNVFEKEIEKIEEEKEIEKEDPIIEDNRCYDEVEEVPLKNEQESITKLFDNVSDEDTYKSYYVYKVIETDTIESIINKYNITKEELADYNDIEDLKVGTKLIIPSSNE